MPSSPPRQACLKYSSSGLGILVRRPTGQVLLQIHPWELPLDTVMMAWHQVSRVVDRAQEESDLRAAVVIQEQRGSAFRAEAARRDVGRAIARRLLEPSDVAAPEPDQRGEGGAGRPPAHAAVAVMNVARRLRHAE